MDSFPFQRTSKVTPDETAVEGDRDDGLPLGSVHSFSGNLIHMAKLPSQRSTEIISDQLESAQTVNPYTQPFTIEAAFSLSIDKQFLPWYLEGYSLYQESRTSK